MTKTTMSDAPCGLDFYHGLERDPWQPVGIPCPECRCRPALRGSNPARLLLPGDDVFTPWFCQNCRAEFTLADVLRYLWKPKS